MSDFVCSRSTDKLSVPYFLSFSLFYIFIFLYCLFFVSYVSRSSTRRWPHVAGAANLPLPLFPPSQTRDASLALLASVTVSENQSLPPFSPYKTAHPNAMVYVLYCITERLSRNVGN